MHKSPQMDSSAKVKDFRKSMGQLVSHSREFIPYVVTAIVLAVAGTIFSLIGPNKLQDITEIIEEGLMSPAGVDTDKITEIAVFLVVLYVLAFIFTYTQGFIMTTVTQKISQNLRNDISHKINRIPLNYFNKTSLGDVLSRVTNDVDMIGHSLNQSIVTVVTAVTMFLGSLFMMLWTNVLMAVTAVITTMVGFLFMSLVMGHSQKYFVQQQQELGRINGHIEEIYSGHNVVKVSNAMPDAETAFENINNRLYNSAWKSQFLSGLMMPVMGFIGNFGYVAVCIVGAALVMNGKISFGVIVAFMIYIRLFTNPLSQIAQAATNIQAAAAASERVFEFLSEEEMSDECSKTAVLENVKGDVEFRHVRFGYTPEKIIINDFSAHAMAGKKVAIVGPTGAGKTTMVNLLMRFYELNGGQILIDGVPTSELTRKNVHELFCMVLQDTWLFEGTVRENIVYSKENVTDEEITKACKAVGIDHFIRTLPKGYDTVLNDKANLSAGQKQLITIARAMIENAPLLILDEATSSVDTRTEVLIQEAMDKLTEGRTSFVIAHRLSTIKNADLILVMKDGDIIESGNHTELLEKGGFYAELYNSQFENAS
ncbi:MAG: ABC transporter ATP-binding protein [Oscillospiraceae bacterium]|nr:ABC transporter ATP-binding protein [Oscillospiraceae bacterium]